MKKILLICLGLCLLTACKEDEPAKKPDQKITPVAKMNKSSKRGVAFSFARIDDLNALCPYITWDYNWANSPWETAGEYFDAMDIQYCPMCWNRNYSVSRIATYAAEHPSTEYLLGFNEPNLTDQANMTPAVAAQYWPEVVDLAKTLDLKLVSPAMNYGTLAGYHDPIKWMDEFLAQPNVSLDDIDAIALHCYMTSPEGVINFIKLFEKYGKPIWLTEFCAWDAGAHLPGNVYSQMVYMSQMLNFLEQSPLIERYSWFIPRYKTEGTYPYMQLLTSDNPSQLTDAGKIYCYFSTFDKSAWLDVAKGFDAAQYVASSDYKITVLPSTDTKGNLMVQALEKEQWLDYQICLREDADHFTFRYAALSNTMALIYLDGEMLDVIDLPKTNALDSWKDVVYPVDLPAGAHTLRIYNMDKMFNLSYISL